MPAKKDSKLRYNCYLLSDSVVDVERALRAKYRPGGPQGMTKLPTTAAAPAGAVAYLGSSDPRRPVWAQQLAAAFTGADAVANVSHRLVIFLPVKNRWFAVCFGYGSSALEWDLLDHNFGLRVAARRFAPEAVQELRSRRVDATARTQSVTLPGGAQLRDFGVPLEGEFVRKIIGRLGTEEGSVVAGDSIIFRADTDLSTVQGELGEMLDDLENADVQEAFEFIDALEPLRNSDAVAKELDRLLAAAILERPQDISDMGDKARAWEQQLLEFAPPDDVRLEDVDHFSLTNGPHTVRFTGLSLAALRAALAEANVKRGAGFLKSARIIAVAADGQPASELLSVRSWVVFEASRALARYILTLGRWFRLQESYAEQLDRDLKSIFDVTGNLKLVDWQSAWDEKTYNEEAVKGRGDLLRLDRRLCPTEDGNRIEVCDLLHQDGYLIHVKRYNGSQTLSHLFAQGTVSAELLKMDSLLKPAFVSDVQVLDATFVGIAQAAAQRVTYAIAVADNRAIPIGLPTFSKVNLRDRARQLKLLGAEPSIARIVIV